MAQKPAANPVAAAGMRAVHAAYRMLKEIGTRFYRYDVETAERDHRAEFMRRAFHALSFNGISGDYAEFGSHGATTFALAHGEIARWRHERLMWAFDSFAGLPEQQGASDHHPAWKPGKMATSADDFRALCRRRGIPDGAYRTVAGYYEETLAGKAVDDPGLPRDIALAYVDCDLHSSTRTVLEFLRPRLKHGMIIAFDDYFCFSDKTVSGERLASLEVFDADSPWALLPFVQFGWHGMSFIVEDKNLLPGK